MLKNKTFLAIIPARGGSKRLPRKNVLNLAGKPLISWTIDAANNSKYIDKVVVTSDDPEILGIANGIKVKTISRPPELASDTATTFDAIKHAIENTAGHYDYIILLQPTSPLRTEKHIDEAIELLFTEKADAVISVCENDHSPLWSNILPEDGSLENFITDEIKNKRSQDLPIYYRLNGAIYLCDMNRLLYERTFFIKDNIKAYLMDKNISLDIDGWLDFKLAQIIINEATL